MIMGFDRRTVKLILGIVGALALALLIHDRTRWKAKTAQYAELLAAERGAHAATIANVRAAAEQARVADKANIERVEARQSAINERSDHDFEERLADARAAAGRLRGERTPAAGGAGAGRTANLPGLSPSTASTHQAAGEDRLPQTDRLIATEQAIQLDELIKWVERQHEVDPGGMAPD